MLEHGLTDKERRKIESLFSKTYWKWVTGDAKGSKKVYGANMPVDRCWESHNAGVRVALNEVVRRYSVRLDYVAWFNKYLPAFNARYGTEIQPEPYRRYPTNR